MGMREMELEMAWGYMLRLSKFVMSVLVHGG